MALWVCLDCSTSYAVGLFRCPHCTSTNCAEDHEMPKITVHGGPTSTTATPGEVGYMPPADEAPADAPVETPTRKRARKAREQPADAVAELSVTAEAEVTRP